MKTITCFEKEWIPKTLQDPLSHEDAILSWDEGRYIDQEVQQRKDEILAEHPLAEIDEDVIRNQFCTDPDLLTWPWENLCDELTQLMEAIQEDERTTWKAYMCNGGWRRYSGEQIIHVDDGLAFLRAILPNTGTYYIHLYRNVRNVPFQGKIGLAIQNYHHDSPVGNEWYYVYPYDEDAEEQAWLDEQENEHVTPPLFEVLEEAMPSLFQGGAL